ncbi:MAG: ADP-ribosylglycohydrolase family protein [Bacteroidota bacterium]
MNDNYVKSGLIGLVVGDALGVPVEFINRKTLQMGPVTGMREFGSHHQPIGTWSDDSSLACCLAEMLSEKYSLGNLAGLFIAWKEHGYWTPNGNVFDIGIATSSAIHSLSKGISPTLAGGRYEDCNGNGSLMRILPVLPYVKEKPIGKRFDIIKDVSSLTHAHIRSVLACFIYIEFAIELLSEKDKWKALGNMRQTVNLFLNDNPICSFGESDRFSRILGKHSNDLFELTLIENCVEDEISSSGYVLNTLEASLWCLLTTDSYSEAVLKAVNLGEDTDTTGAVTGGLAGIFYGYESIPKEWLDVLVKRTEIEKLADKLYKKYNG